MMTKDYSLQALERFLDYAGTKGLMKTETAKARKTAASRVLGIADPAEVEDLRELDLASVFERFVNLKGTEFKPASLKIYQSRVRSAIGEFVNYVNDPAGFRSPSVTRPGGANGGKKTAGRQKAAHKPTEDESVIGRTGEVGVNRVGDVDHLMFPVPIRPNLVVRIQNLPHDLTPAEARRIAAVVEALAVPEAQ